MLKINLKKCRKKHIFKKKTLEENVQNYQHQHFLKRLLMNRYFAANLTDSAVATILTLTHRFKYETAKVALTLSFLSPHYFF